MRAVLAGQATRPPDLITQPHQVQSPRLDFIVGAQNLREGERVITSGDGGLFPRGIPVGVARGGGDGQWRVALSAAQRPIDFVRLIPYVGIEPPEAEPVADTGPPSTAASSVAAIGRETMTPPPTAPSTIPAPPRLRRPPSVVTPADAAAAPAAAPPVESAPAANPDSPPPAPPQ